MSLAEWVIIIVLLVFIIFGVFADSTTVPLLYCTVPSLRRKALRQRIAKLDHELFDHESTWLDECKYCDEIEAGHVRMVTRSTCRHDTCCCENQGGTPRTLVEHLPGRDSRC